MGLVQKIFGFESSWYYLLSYLLRILAAFSFYPLVLYLTKSRIASLFAVIFFSITVVGFDATNWVFNMPSYITIALFNLFLFFFLRAREDKNILILITAGSLYYLAYITTPIRMHGSLPFIFLIETFWIIQERNIRTLKKVGVRLALIIGIFLVIRYTGHSQGPAEEVTQRMGLGIKAMSEMLQAGRFDFIFYPLVMFGSMIIPDFILSSFQILSKKQLLWSALLPSFFGFAAITALVVKDLPVAKVKFIKRIIIGAVCWIVLIILIHQTNLLTFNDSRYILLLLIGGFGAILTAFLMIKFFDRENTSTALFLGLSWSILSFFFAWWWVPNSIFPTTYRYLIVSAVGITILLATIISLGKERKNQISLFVSFSIILIIQVIATRIYINNLLSSHGADISKKIWSAIPRIPEIGKSKEPIIFYFEGDGTNGGTLHDTITFGFPPHTAILYNLREEDGGFPVPMEDFRQVASAAIDGKSMPAYGYPVKPVPIERIYAFHLQGKDNLVNITDVARNKLEEIRSEIKP